MKKNLPKFMVMLALAAVICLPGMALAYSLGPFAGTVESFEGIAPDNHSNGTGGLEYYNNFTIGNGAVTTFASGVALSAPLISGGSYWNGDPFISDFRFSSAVTNGWAGTGNVAPSSVPSGTAWVGTWQNNPFYAYDRDLVFTFTQPMLRVGAYVDGPAGHQITMKAYDASNHLVDTQFADPVPIAQWGSNWIGIQVGNSPQITKVVFSNVDIGVDKLTYSNVPLPPTMLLLGSGLAGLALLRRRPRRQT
jgi:hypothetical protein